MNAPNTSGWRPGTPVAGDMGLSGGPATVTGNRALMLEEPKDAFAAEFVHDAEGRLEA